MRISDWSSDVCSSDLTGAIGSQAISGVLVADLASFKGVRLPYAPKLQYSFRADYDTEITPELAGFAGVGVNGQSKSYSALVLQGSQPFGADASIYDINARTHVNANIGVRSVDDRWRLSVWGQNIFNKYYGRSEEDTTELQSLTRNSYDGLSL